MKTRTAAVDVPLPEEFGAKMADMLGEEEARRLVEALDEEPSVSIRVNRRKVENPEAFARRFEEYGVSRVPWCASGFYLDRRPDFNHDPVFHAGAYYVQEAASMVYESIIEDILKTSDLRNKKELRVLDMCAAPGGKSTAMLNALRGDYILVANEFDRKRAHILKENLDKWGEPNVIITNSPTDRFGGLGPAFDIVAVDAPCSGEGMMRREPVARSQWSGRLVAQCSSLQRSILNDAVECLHPGGFLIYSTCTFNREENEANVGWLCSEKGLSQLGESRHFLPHRERCEGLFVAVLQKPYSEAGVSSGTNLSESALLKALSKAKISIVSHGIEKTVRKGTVEVPSSRAVLSSDFRKSGEFPIVDLPPEEALAYLRRNAPSLPDGSPKGYVAVACEGFPLGLAKNLGNRANNLYPQEWRII